MSEDTAPIPGLFQPEKVEAPTQMAPASNQRKLNLGDVGRVCTKRHSLPLDELRLTNLKICSPIQPARNRENNLVVAMAYLLWNRQLIIVQNAAKHDLIWISSDDLVSSLKIDKKRRIRDGISDHGTQMDVMEPVNTHRVSLKKLETPESKVFSLPKISSNAPQIQTARMKSGLDCGTDAQLPITNALACGAEETASDSHLTARHRSHERNTEPCLVQAQELNNDRHGKAQTPLVREHNFQITRQARTSIRDYGEVRVETPERSTQVLMNQGLLDTLSQAPKLMSSDNVREGKTQTEIPSLQVPSSQNKNKDRVQELGCSHIRVETPRPSTQELAHQAFLDALKEEMRTPTSSIFEGYFPEKYGEGREEPSVPEIYEGPKQILEPTAQVRSKNPQRRASQAVHTHKVILLSLSKTRLTFQYIHDDFSTDNA